MEMLKFLTQKLRQQSLNEVQAFPGQGLDDDRDSGTESDEENAELEALEIAMQHREEDQENAGVPSLSFSQLAPAHCSSPSSSVTVTKRPLQQVNNQQMYRPEAVPFATISQQQAARHYSLSASSSPQGSSDFERCSLDYEPDSSTEFERHSSEEELSVINLSSREIIPEKRKWSQVNGRCSSCTDSSGSSDEEVRELLFTAGGTTTMMNGTMSSSVNSNVNSNSSSNSSNNNKKGSSPLVRPQPLLFSASPPRGVHKLTSRYHYTHHHHHHYHHHNVHPAVSPRLYVSGVARHHHHALSPRKRHRQNLARDVSEAAHRAQRPCLDFEKMQTHHGHYKTFSPPKPAISQFIAEPLRGAAARGASVASSPGRAPSR